VTIVSQDKPSVNVVLRDEYTTQTEDLYSLEEPLVLYVTGTNQNLHNDLTTIEDVLGSKLDPIILDLYNIALIVYVWDQQTIRSGLGPRYFSALMSVSNKDKWNSVKSRLEDTLRFLTGDTFNFEFVQGAPSKEEFRFQKKSEKCVALFSGGLDSLAGVKWVKNEKLDPILVSHPGMGLISDAQKELVSSLQSPMGKNLEWYQIRATAKPGTNLAAREYTEFSRSFLYITLGIIFALKIGIERQFVFENGILALNIPLTQSRIYGNTRTVHPKFTAMYQELLDVLFGHHVTIENPFSKMTKGEVVKLLDSDGFRDLVRMTVSCPNVTRLRYKKVSISKTRHCGVCFPCIVRRTAIHYANLWNYDALYADDITSAYSNIPGEGRKIIFEMMDFARQIDKYPHLDEALNEIPEFYCGEVINPEQLFEMAKRNVTQFKDFLITRCDKSLLQNLKLP